MEEIWINMNKRINVPQSVIDKWWVKLYEKYSEPQRVYHNMENLLRDKFDTVNKIIDIFEDPVPVKFALFFQSYEFDPTTNADYSEQNILHFEEFYKDTNLTNEYLRGRVITFLRGNTQCNGAEAAINQTEYFHNDRRYFKDLDLAILGGMRDDYQRYSSLMEKENSHLETYKIQREKVLRTFTGIPFIYQTDYFIKHFEDRARRNILEEIGSLQDEIDSLEDEIDSLQEQT